MSYRLSKLNTCGTCRNPFHPWDSRPDAEYCSKKCVGASRKARKSFECSECGSSFEVQVNQARRYKTTFCSRACKGSAKSRELTGTGAPWHKGGSVVAKTGYRVISVRGKSYLEHRYAMEQHLGRPLTKAETVHHIDGDKLNNKISNLQLLGRREHQLLHWKQLRETGSWR